MADRPASRASRSAFVAALTLLGLSGPAWAQPARPAVDQARVIVTMGSDGQDTVEATYAVRNAGALKGGVLEHLLVRRPGAEVGEIRLDGAASGTPELERREGISRVRVTVSGEPATYTLRYSVRRAPGTFAVPIVMPAIPVARPVPGVLIETSLPPGAQLAGERFPSVERVETREGRTVVIHRVINIPSVTIAEYGAGRRFTLSLGVTVVALAVLLAVVLGWFGHAVTRRPARAAWR
jgi:hypothetical protein